MSKLWYIIMFFVEKWGKMIKIQLKMAKFKADKPVLFVFRTNCY